MEALRTARVRPGWGVRGGELTWGEPGGPQGPQVRAGGTGACGPLGSLGRMLRVSYHSPKHRGLISLVGTEAP